MNPSTVPQITPYHGDVIDSARKLALAEHAKHKHGALPYSYHLVAVAGIVSCYTTDPDVIAAAWLHDIVEDCESIDLEVVEAMTNARVADIVDRLTDPPGPRELAKQVSMPRILRSKEASLIKQADRYHNHASTILDRSVKHAKLYFAEVDDFVDGFMSAGTAVHPLILQILNQRHALHQLSRHI
jgi:(p)ppGpp synthase/HD superfamily hydrolase